MEDYAGIEYWFKIKGDNLKTQKKYVDKGKLDTEKNFTYIQAEVSFFKNKKHWTEINRTKNVVTK